MKKSLKMKQLLLVTLVSVLFAACKYETRTLGSPPEAGFTVTPVAGEVNRYLLTSTSSNSFRYDWDKGDGAYIRGNDTITVYFPDAGDYLVRLLVYGHNGMDSASAIINVAADDPAALTPLKMLTGNSSKTWILQQPTGGALWVGPNDPGAGAWWSNTAADVSAPDRVCLFNNEYTFQVDGTYIYDDKGDIRVDDEGGNAWPTDIGLPIGCFPTNSIPAQYQAWGSGTHTFTLLPGNKLRVSGYGAHLGLYKVGENGTTATPENSITYDIMELTQTTLVVKKQYDWGQWRFAFVVKP